MEQHTLHFRGPNRYPSSCDIRIYRKSSIVIATDIDQGTSVTNACDIIANEVVSQYNIDAQRLFFIEQYRPDRPDQTTDLVQFDFVDMKVFRHPRWTHISAEEFNRIIQLAEEIEQM